MPFVLTNAPAVFNAYCNNSGWSESKGDTRLCLSLHLQYTDVLTDHMYNLHISSHTQTLPLFPSFSHTRAFNSPPPPQLPTHPYSPPVHASPSTTLLPPPLPQSTLPPPLPPHFHLPSHHIPTSPPSISSLHTSTSLPCTFSSAACLCCTAAFSDHTSVSTSPIQDRMNTRAGSPADETFRRAPGRRDVKSLPESSQKPSHSHNHDS